MFRLLILILALNLTLYGQDTLNRVDGSGRKQGHWIKSDSLGRKVYSGFFIDDKPTGEFRHYYPEGKLKTISVFDAGGTVARTRSYYRNGKIMAAGNFRNERKDSTWLFYSEINGALVAEELYVNGLREGVSRTFLLKGGVSEITTWRHGVRDGLWEQYYTGGALKIRCYFKDDEKEGPLEAFDTDGKLMIKGQYRGGRQDGIWTYYNEKGLPEKRETYQNGVLLKSEDQLEKTR